MTKPTIVLIAPSDAPADVDLPTIAVPPISAGGRRTLRLSLFNPNRDEAVIGSVRASCPCVTVAPGSIVVPARGAAEVEIRVDLADEPDFVGGMRPEIRLMSDGGRCEGCFSLSIQARR